MAQDGKLNEAKLERFFWWMNERHQIYLNKQAGKPWPWTEDEILRTYSFTNVFRELDKVTVWLRENWREPFSDHPCLYLNLAMFRQFNWPGTMELTGFVVDDEREVDEADGIYYAWNPQRLTDVVEVHQRAGNKVWTGAYLIRGQAKTDIKWTSKAQYMFHKVLNPLWQTDEPEWHDMTLEQAWEWWMQFEGFGHFLSYEVVTDMRYTPYLRHASDKMTWANPGPGAMRGIHRLYDMPTTNTRESRKPWYIAQMRKLLALAPQYMASYMPELEMREIEHSLCEFDKYLRVELGEGRPRAKYKPPIRKIV